MRVLGSGRSPPQPISDPWLGYSCCGLTDKIHRGEGVCDIVLSLRYLVHLSFMAVYGGFYLADIIENILVIILEYDKYRSAVTRDIIRFI